MEGWIGSRGIQAAAIEFEKGGYHYVVTTGGLTSEDWGPYRWEYSEIARDELLRVGIPSDRVIAAPARDVESQRTYESAMAVWQALHTKGILPTALNVFTLGAHARRSRLVFEKVCGPGTKIGVIAWVPPDYKSETWWQSSDRTENMIKETGGIVFEIMFDSGRLFNPVRAEKFTKASPTP